LHHLFRRRLRLLPQFSRQARGQLEVVLRVPVFGVRLDRLAELLFGAAEPSEPRVGLFLDDRLLEERAAGPEARRRLGRRLLREIDHLVVALHPVQGQQVVAEDACVFVGGELPHRRQRVEARLGERVLGERLIEPPLCERGVSGRDVRRPSRVADQREPRDEQQRDENRSDRSCHLHRTPGSDLTPV
jgi:hypothetical protein